MKKIILFIIYLNFLSGCNKEVQPKPSSEVIAKQYRLNKIYFGTINDKKKMNYQLVFYSNNRVSEIKTYDSLKQLRLNVSYFYDSNNKLKLEKNLNLSDGYEYEHKYNYDSLDRLKFTVRKFPSSTTDTLFYFYDSLSRIINQKYYKDNKIFSYIQSNAKNNYSGVEYTNDANGLEQRNEYFYDNKNNPFGNYGKDITIGNPYQSNNIVKIKFYNSINIFFYETEYNFIYENDFPISCTIQNFAYVPGKLKTSVEYTFYEYE